MNGRRFFDFIPKGFRIPAQGFRNPGLLYVCFDKPEGVVESRLLPHASVSIAYLPSYRIFQDEYRVLLRKHAVDFDEKFVWD